MLIIPAIDLKDGKCVRLIQGRMQDETVYSDDPEAMARRWADAGAELLHVVDLDAAVQRNALATRACIAGIIRAAGIPVQVGGGMRDIRRGERLPGDGCASRGHRHGRHPRTRPACGSSAGSTRAGSPSASMRAAAVWRRTAGPGPPTSQAVDLARQLEDCRGRARSFSPTSTATACRPARTSKRPASWRSPFASRSSPPAESAPSSTSAACCRWRRSG
ncbi:MAG: HisA/HisF-related TIM barrel protein [Desulfobacterales bacterium]|nr:HisA/HisF-related TIM barrel protein [Desulfobacterales bacterium]